uniref:SET domain-containing protein n=1 Tax=Strongyloides papillosus TaxID=174720 RepID=A0A0N5B5I7_STREA
MVKSPKSAEFVSTDDSSADEGSPKSSVTHSSARESSTSSESSSSDTDDDKSERNSPADENQSSVDSSCNDDNNKLSTNASPGTDEVKQSDLSIIEEGEITSSDSEKPPNGLPDKSKIKPGKVNNTVNPSSAEPARREHSPVTWGLDPKPATTNQPTPSVASGNNEKKLPTIAKSSQIAKPPIKNNDNYDPIKEQDSCAKFIAKVRAANAQKRKTRLMDDDDITTKKKTSSAGPSGTVYKPMRRGGKRNMNVPFKEPTITPVKRVIQCGVKLHPARVMGEALQVTNIRNGYIGTTVKAEPLPTPERLHRDGLHFFFEGKAPENKEAIFHNAVGLGINWPCKVEGHEIEIIEISQIIKKCPKANCLRLEIRIDSSEELSDTI